MEIKIIGFILTLITLILLIMLNIKYRRKYIRSMMVTEKATGDIYIIEEVVKVITRAPYLQSFRGYILRSYSKSYEEKICVNTEEFDNFYEFTGRQS